MKGLYLYVLLLVIGAITGIVALWQAVLGVGKDFERHDDERHDDED